MPNGYSSPNCLPAWEYVHIQLWHQPEGQKVLKLEGEEAKAARKNVGGVWSGAHGVTVWFRGPGEHVVVKPNYPLTTAPVPTQ